MKAPTITIVTPSFNQGQFIEETLRSVLDQGLPDLEYIVIDGGSSDSTVEILQRYEGRLAHWVSEPDLGQADALNKGFSVGTGEIVGYLNSDDLYEPGCLARVVADFRSGPDRAWHAYPVEDFSAEGPQRIEPAPRLSSRVGSVPAETAANDLLQWVLGRVGLHQPGVFWRREQWAALGGFDTRYHYAFDRHFFMKLVAAGYPLVCHAGPPAARFRLHGESKTVTRRRGVDNPFLRERMRICDEFERMLPSADRKQARRLRTEDAISTGWRMFHEGAPRWSCWRWLARLALSRPDSLRRRYFWGSAARFLVQPRRPPVQPRRPPAGEEGTR